MKDFCSSVPLTLKDTSVLCCESFAFLELGFKLLGAVEVLEVGCRENFDGLRVFIEVLDMTR